MSLIRSFAILLGGMALTSSAFAADPAPAPYDWSGAYFGLQGGWTTGNVNQRIPAYGPGIPVGSISGGLLGAYAGVRQQLSSSLVMGAELGANWRFLNGNNLSGGSGGELLNTKQDWDASLVGKIGVPLNNVLIYGLGGVDVTSFNAQYNTGFPVSPNATSWGWTAGAGIETVLQNNWTARLEYRYTSWSEANVACSTCGPTFVAPAEHSIAVGLSYVF
jgi:outer membrane immunogenic protein